MIVHQTYAQIQEDEVKNIIICDNYELANYLARATYGQEAFAVDCTQYPCGIGDSYRDGTFYRILEDGTPKQIDYIPTAEQQVEQLQAELTCTQMALTEQFEENLLLQEEVTATQLALTEMYEGLGV